jgi:hypothetical protein
VRADDDVDLSVLQVFEDLRLLGAAAEAVDCPRELFRSSVGRAPFPARKANARVVCSAVVALVQRAWLRLRWLPTVASSLAPCLRFTFGKLPLRPLTHLGMK